MDAWSPRVFRFCPTRQRAGVDGAHLGARGGAQLPNPSIDPSIDDQWNSMRADTSAPWELPSYFVRGLITKLPRKGIAAKDAMKRWANQFRNRKALRKSSVASLWTAFFVDDQLPWSFEEMLGVADVYWYLVDTMNLVDMFAVYFDGKEKRAMVKLWGDARMQMKTAMDEQLTLFKLRTFLVLGQPSLRRRHCRRRRPSRVMNPTNK